MIRSQNFKLIVGGIMVFAFLGTLLDTYAGGRRKRNQAPSQVTLSDDSTAKSQGAGDFRRDISFGGDARFYNIHVPKSYKPGSKVPLVMVLHGGGGSPDAARTTSGFDKLADENNFITIYPAGTGERGGDSRLSWNILKSGTFATQQNKDDLGFIRAVLKDVQSRFSIDEKRIYATGISQGGMMCYRFACDPDLSGRIAAIAPVAAVMTVDPKDCRPSREMPIIHFHGLKDEFIPFDGGVGAKLKRIDNVPRPGVPETVNFWTAKNNLGDKPRDRGSRGLAGFQDFGKDGQAGEFILWKLEDGGHTWPGGDSGLPEFFIGKVNRDISASEIIWKFFTRHSL
jgi:polyhydroxybutyrate depolymerase